MEAIIEVAGLSARYGQIEAVKGAFLRAEAGRIVSVIGANGAGKSTLLRAIMGILPGSASFSGEIRYEGSSVLDWPVEKRVLAGMCLVPETRELFGSMSVIDNLILGAFSRRRSGRSYLRQKMQTVYKLFPRLEERELQVASSLSGGERQMLALGRALMGEPKLLMLDEPSLGLAPVIMKDIFSAISKLRDAGVTVLLIEQNANAALRISDYGYVFENGVVAAEGAASELMESSKIVESYLGKRRSA